jgi:hypothetical protein
VLATALAVWATSSGLAGTTAASYGFNVTILGIGAKTYNVGNNGAAFGVADNTSISVAAALRAVGNQAVAGNLYNGSDPLRDKANRVFDGINKAGGLK